MQDSGKKPAAPTACFVQSPSAAKAHASDSVTLTIVVPTFNESLNLEPLAHAVQSALQGIRYELLIADDDSPDLTWLKAKQMTANFPAMRVLRRKSQPGLAASVIDGFLHARGDIVACIDADLQHDPCILPAMLRLLEEGNDLVIGSRYVAKGGVRDWNIFRRLQSLIATTLARVCLGVEIRDPMSGFFMMRRQDFFRIRKKLSAQGFKILLEILMALQPQKLAEVPYTFGPRIRGTSKLSSRVIFCYLRQVIRLARQSTTRRHSYWPPTPQKRWMRGRSNLVAKV